MEPDNSEVNVKESHGFHNQGWQKVINSKKQRRQDTKDPKKVNPKSGLSGNSSRKSYESQSLFSALDSASEQRHVRLAASAASHDELDSSSSDSTDEEGEKYSDVEENSSRITKKMDVEKVKVKRQKQAKVTPADAASTIDPSDLKAFLSQISESFPDLPDIQLMRSADYFARAFSVVTTAHFNFQKILRDEPASKSVDIPFSSVPESVVLITGEWLAKQSLESLGSFAVTLLDNVVEVPKPPAKKGGAAVSAPSKAKVGILVLLAILLRSRPDCLLLQSEALKSNPLLVKPEKVFILAWAFGQVAQADLISGMWLWVRNLLPLAVGKQGTPLSRDVALTFFESIICKNLKKARSTLVNGCTKKGERLVPPAALTSLMRAAFPLDNARTKATERFLSAYPLVKSVALAGSARSKTTKPAALQLLPLSLTAAGEEPPALSEEACGNFIWCLSENQDCYKQWERHHIEQLRSSTRVLEHIIRNWKTVKGRFGPFDDLRKTLLAFRKKHREIFKDDPSSEEEKLVKKADVASKLLLAKLSSFPSCIKATATLAVGSAVMYGLFLLSPSQNPWGWDGQFLLSKTHPLF